jgi:hypothetical protein
MKRKHSTNLALLVFTVSMFLVSPDAASAQTPNAYGYSTGYGTVYGSFGLASTMQSMYNVARAQTQRSTARNATVKRWGAAAVEKAERETASKSSRTNPQIVVPPPRVVRNHGVFRPDPAVDTGKAMADALAETPDQKTLIRQIYADTKAAYEEQAAVKGWKNNIAGGLTFFTVAAMTVYQDAEEPSMEAANAHYELLNATLDAIPALARTTDREKQNFNNLMIGLSGILLAGYTEGKQTGDTATLESYKKLSGMLIKMVLKMDPEDLVIENGRIVVK